MDKCEEAPVGSNALFFIRPRLVCGKYFKRKAFSVTSCGCMYHPFCLWAHLELFRRLSCVACTCNKTFEDDMIELFGYHQYRIELAKIKAERVQLRRRSTTLDSSTSRPCKFNFSSTILFRFLMLCTIYLPDLVYFLLFILALSQVRFLFCPKYTCGLVFVPFFSKALLAQHSCGIAVTWNLKSRLKF